MKRVACFIDGYNLYHALRHNSRNNHHKWLDLKALISRLIPSKSESISAIYYFSAYAHWLPDSYRRHREYVAALEATGVNVVLGHFKKKKKKCKICGIGWRDHEEKETDVNIALHMLNGAYKDSYDKAMLVSRDSDLAPVLKMIRSEFPTLEIEVVAPPQYSRIHHGHSVDLVKLATSKKRIRPYQIENCLLPRQVIDPQTGKIAATRPTAYDPPQSA